ncbi:hypothetical protein [Nocardiopsis sp. CNS-639]|uniref:hypothetical protein n=1 Tax=Nocardiopsis sp. CNS-639 TaxID=1169153 RepID=UPI00039C13A9
MACPDVRELSDAGWALLAPPMPTNPRRGRKWADHRRKRIANRLRIDADSGEELSLRIDSTRVRAHQHAAGAAKKGKQRGTKWTGPRPWAAPGTG